VQQYGLSWNWGSVAEAMQLFIRDAGQTLAVSADPNAEVLSLKEQVATAWGIPAEEQRLIFAGKSASVNLSFRRATGFRLLWVLFFARSQEWSCQCHAYGHASWNRRSLDASATLSACGLTDESTVFVNLELAGGGKKRKKKTYTKPKKIKHKRKKASLLSWEMCLNADHGKFSVRLAEKHVHACIGLAEMSLVRESVQGRCCNPFQFSHRKLCSQQWSPEVKLAVLKFYKVDGNDKVTRLRRECPHEICGPGVFMAMHFNRYYCGKCHLTYLIKKGEGESWDPLGSKGRSPCGATEEFT